MFSIDIIKAIFLGLIQGLTEFIPVSSSGHLEIMEYLFGSRADNFHLFLEFVNIGTLLALLIFFRKRLWQIIQDIFCRKNYRLFINLIITTIPAGLIGFLFSDFITETPFFSSPFTIAIALGTVGLFMIFIDHLPHLSSLKDENTLSKPRALLIGLAQTLALIPGVSRSGSTIVTGRLVGLNSQSAAEYSFLASIPIMLGVCLKMILSSTSRAYVAANLGLLIISNLAALISGLLAIKFLMKFLKQPRSLQTFGYYRVVLAGILLILAMIR